MFKSHTTNIVADAAAKQNLLMFLVTQGTEENKRWKNSNKDFAKKRIKGAKQDTLHKRIIELQKFSREKVDKYVRGLIVRNLINELKKEQCPSVNTSKQLNWLNWDIFDKILINNLESGLVKINIDIVDRALKFIPRPLLPDEYVDTEQSQLKVSTKKNQKRVGVSKFLDIISSKLSITSNESKISKISKMSRRGTTFRIQKSASKLSIFSTTSKMSQRGRHRGLRRKSSLESLMSTRSQRSQRGRHRGLRRKSSQESLMSTRSQRSQRGRHRGLRRKSSQESLMSTRSIISKSEKHMKRLSLSGRIRSKTSIRTLNEKYRYGSKMSMASSMKDSTSQTSLYSLRRRRKRHGLTKEEQILAMIISQKVQAIRDGIVQRYQSLIDEKDSSSRRSSYMYKKNSKLWNENLYPEIHTDDEIYKVCYTCLKRSEDLQVCIKCGLIYFCSLKCNIKDIMNLQSNHKCLCEFYGRVAPALYKIKKDGCLSRIFTYRDSSEERILEMKKLYGKGKKVQLSSKQSNIFKPSKTSIIKKKSKKNVHTSSPLKLRTLSKKRKITLTKPKKNKAKQVKEKKHHRNKRKHGYYMPQKGKLDKSTITALSYRFGKGANKNLKVRMKNLRKGEKWRRGGQWRRMSTNEEQLLIRGVIKQSPKMKLPWYDRNADILKNKPLTEYTPYQQLLLVLDSLFDGQFDVERYSPWVLSRCGAFFYKSQRKFEQGNYSLI